MHARVPRGYNHVYAARTSTHAPTYTSPRERSVRAGWPAATPAGYMPRTMAADPDQMATRHHEPTPSYTNPGCGRNQYSHLRDLADHAVRDGRVLSEAEIMGSYVEAAAIPAGHVVSLSGRLVPDPRSRVTSPATPRKITPS